MNKELKKIWNEWLESQNIRRSIGKMPGLLGKNRFTIKQSHEKLLEFAWEKSMGNYEKTMDKAYSDRWKKDCKWVKHSIREEVAEEIYSHIEKKQKKLKKGELEDMWWYCCDDLLCWMVKKYKLKKL